MDFALTEEQGAIFDMAHAFGQEHIAPFARQWEAAGEIPRDLWPRLAELGFGGLYVSEDHGGSGLGRLDATLVFEALSMACPSVAFKAEAIVAPTKLLPYLGTGSHTGKVSDLAYHNSLMVQIWSMLAFCQPAGRSVARGSWTSTCAKPSACALRPNCRPIRPAPMIPSVVPAKR